MKDKNSKGEFNERLGSFCMRYRLIATPTHTLMMSAHIFICDGQRSSDIEHTLNKVNKLQPYIKFAIEK